VDPDPQLLTRSELVVLIRIQIPKAMGPQIVMKATAPYFSGSILLRAIKSKIIVVLTYVRYIRNVVNLINMGKFYFEDVQF
jgi:hypothetical protein